MFKFLLLFKTKARFQILTSLRYLNFIKLLFTGAKFWFSGCLIGLFYGVFAGGCGFFWGGAVVWVVGFFKISASCGNFHIIYF